MVLPDRLLVQLLRLVDAIPEPPRPPPEVGGGLFSTRTGCS